MAVSAEMHFNTSEFTVIEKAIVALFTLWLSICAALTLCPESELAF